MVNDILSLREFIVWKFLFTYKWSIIEVAIKLVSFSLAFHLTNKFRTKFWKPAFVYEWKIDKNRRLPTYLSFYKFQFNWYWYFLSISLSSNLSNWYFYQATLSIGTLNTSLTSSACKRKRTISNNKRHFRVYDRFSRHFTSFTYTLRFKQIPRKIS